MKKVSLSGVILHLPDRFVTNTIEKMLDKGWYENKEKCALIENLRPGDSLLEVGGGIGYTAMVGANIIGADRVTTIEANPEIYNILKNNLYNNDLSNINALNLVVLDQPNIDLLDFFIPPAFWAGSISKLGMGDDYITVQVKTISLTDLLNEKRPSVLMVDVEGSEADFFKESFPENLRLIIVELHPKKYSSVTVQKIFRRLDQRGFFYQPSGSNGSVVCFERLSDV